MRAAAPVSLVVLTLALQGRLKVGLDVEQACQGVVTHTRSVRQPATPLSAWAAAQEPVHPIPPPLLHCVNPKVY